MLTFSQGSGKVDKNKRITFKLLTMLLCLVFVIIFSYSFYEKYTIKNDVSNINVKENDNPKEEVVIDLDDEKQDDLIIESEIKAEVKSSDPSISNSTNNKTTKTSDNNKTKNTNNNSSNISNKSSTNNSISSNEKQVSEVKEIETKVETVTNDDKKENVNIKQEEQKSVEITFETPDKSSFENDSAYINLMKQIFSTFEDCDKKGEEVRLSDMINISSSRCESVNYKGTEVGWRLKIRYTDGTWKEYKK